MIFGLFRRRNRDAEHKVYCEIVAQARQPVFYSGFHVPDTIDGRFDLIVAHAVLYFRRMRGEGKAVFEFTQYVFDLFFQDMDASLREMGVSDTRVPKKVKVMGEAFYGRADVYNPAIDSGNVEELAAALGRNVYPDNPEPIAQTRLAHYILESANRLGAQTVEDLMSGQINWADPEAFRDLPV
ncbi:ubiquinol-cytochrome C chaperone family protein [Roseibium marinum]|uniref:Cytochrome b pre-mRNA-processing protein 3 n=1 Tax=Roseibium marinum TaxID=281252 RepID=A0A2S3UMY6_9HYPH|nr:ubiquinol-cytochrome C chaperone family protein [Roseibium marinum]POF28940.1 cytochrome b pre-mRNA-processing protein 3 [Roseibium marinum]